MAQPRTLLPGHPWPLGAHVREDGVHVAVFSQRATRIDLCVFDATGQEEIARHPLHGPDDGIFHGILPGAGAGLVYGFRAHGRYQPENGYRFNPAKLLLDPYARALTGTFEWHPAHLGYAITHPQGIRQPDGRDNAAWTPKATVVGAPSPLPDGLRLRPSSAARRRLADSVLYELHVKGFTAQMPGVPEAQRGTFAGLAHPAAIARLKRLGVTTLSLQPVQEWIDEMPLVERGLRNYWGYNTLAFFCPARRLAANPADPIGEFRTAVATLQAHGFEVLLDVVFNHTAEGDKHGPTLSFRGLDNASWYRLVGDDRSRYENASGCGNTLRLIHPRVTQFVLDALRYWVETFGVDGFRFDLAPALGRTRQGFDPAAPFFVALRQDPTLANVHLIAEPWDCGHEGYQLGRLPGRFAEWNDRFRDSVRGYWLGTGVRRSEFARRFTASSDLFHHGQRKPMASVNFVAAHDGRPLADVVSYAHKHNVANGEGNRDGHDHEVCANFGVEGSSTDAAVREGRHRARRAMLATVLLSQGTPMLLAGDEVGNSQGGNNNAYCQDNPIGWVDWSAAEGDDTALIAQLIALRQSEPYLRYPEWFSAEPQEGQPTIDWLRPDGEPMRVEDWHDERDAAFACRLTASATTAPRGCLAFNPGAAPRLFCFPDGPWQVLLDSSGQPTPDPHPHDGTLMVPARSLLVLRRLPEPKETRA